ncbi:MAG: nucleotide exchange factor GrpE [Candidatus Azotimanducaceae bacterium]|jgi:molecular chaperone GrpE
MGNEPESDKQDEELQANEGGESDQSSSDQSGDQASEQEGQSGAQHADAEQSSEADELAKVKDQLLRTVAEMENVRRRSQRDIENAHKFAVEKLLGDLLPVLDSLEKAEEVALATDNAASMAEGISLSLKLFVGILEKAGVAIVHPIGEPFDPQLHEAMAMVPNPDAEPNSVMDVMQRGYTLNGRLVRAAKVIVVKGE